MNTGCIYRVIQDKFKKINKKCRLSISWHFFAIRSQIERFALINLRCQDPPTSAAPGMLGERIAEEGAFPPGNCLLPPSDDLSAISSHRLLHSSRMYGYTNPHAFSVPDSRAVLLCAAELSCFPPELVVVLFAAKQTLVVGSFSGGYTSAFTERVGTLREHDTRQEPSLRSGLHPLKTDCAVATLAGARDLLQTSPGRMICPAELRFSRAGLKTPEQIRTCSVVSLYP